jgi:excisionase family DNA binding protein
MRKDRLKPVDPERWLTLTEASRALGVTPNTLRRWADRGQIPSFVTPGGHRRFPLAAIAAFVPSNRAQRPALAAIGASSDHMVRAYRKARQTSRAHEPAGWMANLSEADRSAFRRRGMELVRNLLAYLDADRERGGSLFTAAERQAREYGAEAAASGASLSDTVEGFLRFRKPFVDELALLARRRHLDTREATELLADAESALDRLLIALMLGHEATSPAKA